MRKGSFDVTTIINYAEQFSDVKRVLKDIFGGENGFAKVEVTNYIDTIKKARIDPDNIDLHCDELLKINAVNEMIKSNRNMSKTLYNRYASMSLDEVLNKTESSVLKVVNKYSSVNNDPERIGEGMMEKYMNREVNVRGFKGFATPFEELNQFTNGILRKGGVTLINAPTGVGKSIVLKNIVKHVGVDLDEPIYWGANEMTPEEQRDRILAEVAGVNPDVISNGLYNKKGNENLKKRVSKGIKVLEEAPIFLDQIRGYTPEMLVRKARFYKKKYDIKGFVWDYVKRSSAYSDSDDQLRHWLGDVVGVLKEQIADPLDIFVVSATQSKTYQELFAAESQDVERHATCFIPLKKLTPKEKKRLEYNVGDYAFIVKKNRYGSEHDFKAGQCVPLKLDKSELKFKETLL